MKGYHLMCRFYFPFTLEMFKSCKSLFFKTEQIYSISRMLKDCAFLCALLPTMLYC